MELLDIVDENGDPTGEVVERTIAHAEGIRHRTSHVWLLRRRNGKVQVLVQKRSADKDSNPGCLDISSAGHIPAGVDFVPSALRELKEELGIDAFAEELIYCGRRIFRYEEVFYGKPFLDDQISNVYALWRDLDESDFSIQTDELEWVRWIDYNELIEIATHNKVPHCIHVEELELLKHAF